MNTDSPLDDLRPRIDKLLDFFTEPGKGEKYLKDLADDLEKLYELYCHKQVIEARQDQIMLDELAYSVNLDVDESEIMKVRDILLAELRKTL